MSYWGTCKKCNTAMEVHYDIYCPLCDTDKFEIKDERIYDLFKLMKHMEVKGFMSQDEYWKDYVMESYPQLGNDMYLNMWFGEGDNEEINKYHEYVRKFLGIDDEEERSVIMKISW